MGINLEIINSINNYLIKDINIDYTFLNVVSIKNLRKRLNKRKNLNKYDKFKSSFYNKVQRGFIKLAKNKPKYHIVDSDKQIDLNKKIILNQVKRLISIK